MAESDSGEVWSMVCGPGWHENESHPFYPYVRQTMRQYGLTEEEAVARLAKEGCHFAQEWQAYATAGSEDDDGILGPALMFGGAVATALGDAASRAGKAGKDLWRTLGNVGKGAGLLTSLVGGYLTYKDTKEKAEEASGEVHRAIDESSGSWQPGDPTLWEDLGESGPGGYYPGYQRRDNR